MSIRGISFVLALVLFVPGVLMGDETSLKSRIVGVGLFKNGLALVKREATLPGPGVYRIDEVPTPIHGTYWVESNAPVETAIQIREVEAPLGPGTGANLQEELAGKKVVVHLREGKASPVSGMVARLQRARGPDAWHSSSAPRGFPYAEIPTRDSSRFLILESGKRRTYVDISQIVSLDAEEAGSTVVQRRPQLVITVDKTEKKPVTLHISYLAQGLSWAPSYRVDITDPKTLTLEQAAVIKNELANLDGALVSLISGFPSTQYAHVTSPLSPRTTWAAFFQELSRRVTPMADATSNVISQQMVMPSTPLSLDLSARPAGEGVDLHYQSIGKRTLAEGDSLDLTVARGQASYERIVEWLVPDNRDADGNLTGRRREEGEGSEGALGGVPWDALRFRNPLPFPMTTAPAMIVAHGNFNGQRLSTWANTGEETILHVTRALSIRTRNLEQEEPQRGGDERQVVYIGGRRFRQTTVQADLMVSNHRQETVKMVIRRRFSGDLLKADGEPKSVLREEGVYSVNRRNELIWSFSLKPGEDKKLAYSYRVLVSF